MAAIRKGRILKKGAGKYVLEAMMMADVEAAAEHVIFPLLPLQQQAQ